MYSKGSEREGTEGPHLDLRCIKKKTHNKQPINTTAEWNPIFTNESQLCEFDSLSSNIEGRRQPSSLPSFTSSAYPPRSCAMLAHSGGRSVSPPCMTDLWAALACLWDATVLERKKTSLVCFAVTQQERVLQCSTKVQLDRRWSYTFQSLKQLADILPCQLSPVLYVCSVYKNLPGGRKGGSTMLSHCCNLRASVRTCKMHTVSSWLLDHLLQDSSTPWINE